VEDDVDINITYARPNANTPRRERELALPFADREGRVGWRLLRGLTAALLNGSTRSGEKGISSTL